MALLMMADSARVVTGGVDTHKDFHVAVVVDETSRRLGVGHFVADIEGYGELLAWMGSFGPIDRVGVEGTGSYGKGLARFLSVGGVEVVEVLRPDRQLRRRNGKTDAADAEAAAITALSGRDSGAPKRGTGPIESLRVLRVARDSAVTQRTAVTNQIGSLLMTAPEPVIKRYADKTGRVLYKALAASRPGPDTTDPKTAVAHALNMLARQQQFLTSQIRSLDENMAQIVSIVAPRLTARVGVGPQTAAALLICAGDNPDRLRSPASFAALCGAAPIPASSGRTQNRHRLNRAGDRRANSALWRTTMTRMRIDPRTKTYVTKRTGEGLSKQEIMRCLKTYIAREFYPIILADLAVI